MLGKEKMGIYIRGSVVHNTSSWAVIRHHVKDGSAERKIAYTTCTLHRTVEQVNVVDVEHPGAATRTS